MTWSKDDMQAMCNARTRMHIHASNMHVELMRYMLGREPSDDERIQDWQKRMAKVKEVQP